MPTGYTQIVAENEKFTFPEFAMRCARNFGALMNMRGEPLDAPIPEKFEIAEHYQKDYESAKAAYDKFIANPPTYEELEKQYEEYITKETVRRVEISEEKDIKCRRYNAMLQKVVGWQPPTPEHAGLKEFMIKQLHDSIEFDCSEYVSPLPEKEEWIEYGMSGESLKKRMDVYKECLVEEQKRISRCNQWLKDLRESLNPKK